MVTLRPRVSSSAARDAAAIPLPSEETTPPVTKTYLVMGGHGDWKGLKEQLDGFYLAFEWKMFISESQQAT